MVVVVAVVAVDSSRSSSSTTSSSTSRDVIERNRLPKNSVALEPGDLEVSPLRFFPKLLRAIFSFFKGGGGDLLGATKRGFRTCRGLNRAPKILLVVSKIKEQLFFEFLPPPPSKYLQTFCA